ncbi:helix-turn-helix domain-containing protein [Candidatus Gracilibacteria bacterium]|nr:helix-turn-helix domain-containing protein [Candidatus Gracilibacteria bacterium]NJM88816.1 helix-turn-helix domain-containing protein [Hydrococcus sp. RU_2_2]NJP19349.1 helix-turn-helix domain-containing protein [Hydrococcus sp. CRU_1_1]NJQ97413.1 helix-turn-helix domain-containing protein [Hydrococcus sp. CSU_1_8]
MFFKFKKKQIVIDPYQQQQEKLAQIGSLLYQVRIEKNISLKLIEAKTQIPIRLLKAIEKGDLTSLPEPVYIRGLIKQFADIMQLDGTAIANSFPIDTSIPSRNFRSGFRLPSFQLRPFHLYLVYISLVVLSVRGISNILRESVSPIAIQPQSSTAIKPPPNKTTKPNASKPTPTPKKTPAKPVVTDVKIDATSWLKIVVDGKTAFEGNLPKGTQRTWTAQQQITIIAGNAGGVIVAFNDEKPKPLGKLGQVVTVTYKAKPSITGDRNKPNI